MASGFKLTLFLAIVIMLYHGANAQSSCTSTLVTLSPCLNYVTGNSSTPSSSCCSSLAAVVQSQPQCLCTFVNGGGSSLGININQTLALSLPAACGITAPSVGKCNGGSGTTSPASSPESPPADSSNNTPSTTNTTIPAGSGSKTVPTTATTSDSSNLGIHLSLTLFFASIVLWASNNVAF